MSVHFRGKITLLLAACLLISTLLSACGVSPDTSTGTITKEEGVTTPPRTVSNFQPSVLKEKTTTPPLDGHFDTVHSLVFSPDGKVIASGSSDQTIKLWEVSSGKLIRTLPKQVKQINQVVFSPDGKILASGGDDFAIKLWDVTSGNELATLRGHVEGIRGLTFSPDGKLLASAASAQDGVKIWDVAARKELQALKGTYYPLVFSPDGKTLVSTFSKSNDSGLRLWDTTNWQEIASFIEPQNVSNIIFSPDGKRLITAGGVQDFSPSGNLQIREMPGGKELSSVKLSSSMIDSFSFSADGKTIIANESRFLGMSNVAYYNGVPLTISLVTDQVKIGGYVMVLDVNTGKELKTLKSFNHSLSTLALSPDGKTVAIADNSSILLLEAESGQEIRAMYGAPKVNSADYSPDGKVLALPAPDNSVRLVENGSGKELKLLKGHTDEIQSIKFSGDGKTLATGSKDSSIRLWDVASGKELKQFKGHISWVNSVAFSPDGKTLASGSSDTTIKLWDVDSGKELSTIKPGGLAVWSVIFSPDGKTLASGSGVFSQKLNAIRLWEVLGGKELNVKISQADSANSLSFSPDGKMLAGFGGDEAIKVWDTSSGKVISTLQEEMENASTYVNIPGYTAFTPNGKTLLIFKNYYDASIIVLWDIAGQKEIFNLILKDFPPLHMVTLSPDARTLTGIMEDSSLKVWELAEVVPSAGEATTPTPIATSAVPTTPLAPLPTLGLKQAYSIN